MELKFQKCIENNLIYWILFYLKANRKNARRTNTAYRTNAFLWLDAALKISYSNNLIISFEFKSNFEIQNADFFFENKDLSIIFFFEKFSSNKKIVKKYISYFSHFWNTNDKLVLRGNCKKRVTIKNFFLIHKYLSWKWSN